MGHAQRILASVAILLAGVVPLAAFDGPTQTKHASKKAAAAGDQAKPAPGAEAKATPDPLKEEKDKATATATRMLDAGIKAYQDGDTKQALRAFDVALRGGALNSQQVARALYYRGLVYRKDGKQALAISDLTNAIWLKDGLSPDEKQQAMQDRLAAYKDAGISDVPAIDQSGPIAASAAPPMSPVAPSGASGWETAMTGPAAVPQPAAAPQPAPAASSSSGGVSGFFNTITFGLFGGGSSSAPKPPPDEGAVTTASIGDAAKPAPQPEVSSWSQATQVAPVGTTPQAEQPAREEGAAHAGGPPPPPVAANRPVAEYQPLVPNLHKAARAPSGKYLLQVATVRSHEEADLLVARLLTSHGGELGGRDPKIDTAVIGSMGTFYRVRVGPYADAKEPKKLCGALQANGFDCLVVTN
jgi:tetratricopeptide (TPR) repeat protein